MHNKMKHTGVILAAGIGSRLSELTASIPKCLVEVAGKPILKYQLDAYEYAGVEEVILIIGYRSSQIKSYIQSLNSPLSIVIVENKEYQKTNNMYSLYLARDIIAGRSVIINNGDMVIDHELVGRMIQDPNDNVVAVEPESFDEESMKVVIRSDGSISHIAKTINAQESFGCSIDFYKFDQTATAKLLERATEIIEERCDKNQWTEIAIDHLFRESEIYSKPFDIKDIKWVEIDNRKDLIEAHNKFSYFQDSLKESKNIIFDLDGTLYIGDEGIDGASDVTSQLKSSGKQVSYVSNNSSKVKSEYVEKLASLAIETEDINIKLSTESVFAYLKSRNITKIYLISTPLVENWFIEEGFEIELACPDIIVLCFDSTISYKKLREASELMNKGVEAIASHPDYFCPTEKGPLPDVGAFKMLLESTTGRVFLEVFGKPNSNMLDYIAREDGSQDPNTIIFGDRLHTDIMLAKNAGVKSCLVLTGESCLKSAFHSEIKPDFIIESIADLLDYLPTVSLA